MSAEQEPGWLSCPDCDAACRDRTLTKGAELRCGQCGARLKKYREGDTMQRAWAMATMGLVLLLLANVEPIMTFNIAGNRQSNLIITGVFGLIDQGYWPISILVFFSAIAAPALHLMTSWYVLGACAMKQHWVGSLRALKLAEHLEAWNLVPVYAVAIMVSAVKLEMLGEVEWNRGTVWVVATSLCSLCVVQMFDRDMAEKRIMEFA